MAITKATASSIAPAAKGDLVVGSATNDAAILAVGTNNHILTADSAEATGMKWAAAAGGGKVLQVVQATNNTNTTTTNTSYTTTGLEATITPSSVSSKVLVLAYTSGFVSRTSGAESASYTLLAGASEIASAPSGIIRFDTMPQSSSIAIHYLHSPTTTSAVTYKLAMRVAGANTTVGAQKDGALAAMQLLEIGA